MTLDGLPLALANGIGVVGVVVVVGWMLASGRLHTRSEMRRVEASHAAEVKRMEDAHLRELEDAQHERNEWRTEARLNQQTAVELNEQNRAMLSAFGPTLTDFLDSLRRVAGLVRDEEREHDPHANA